MIEFFKKIINNRIFVIIISIVLICALIVVARVFIDNYEFELNNSEVSEEEEIFVMPNENGNAEERGKG